MQQLRNHLVGGLMLPLGALLGALNHVVIDIESGAHASDAHMSKIAQQPDDTISSAAALRDAPWVDAALTRGFALVDVATGDAVRVVVHHAHDLASLYRDDDFAAQTCLVVNVTRAVMLLRRAPARALIQTLLGLVAGWDGCVLVAEAADATPLESLWSSVTVSRCTVVESSSSSVGALFLALCQVRYQTWHLAPVKTPLPRALSAAMLRMPVDARVLLWQLLRAPHHWTVHRLAAAHGRTRRSLERKYERWGLPSPAALLQSSVPRAESREEDQSRAEHSPLDGP